MDVQYNLPTIPEGVVHVEDPGVIDDAAKEAIKWSGKGDVPKLGDTVEITMNSLGKAVVYGYFVAAGWLGVQTVMFHPPAWHLRQSPKGTEHHRKAFVFGAELKW